MDGTQTSHCSLPFGFDPQQAYQGPRPKTTEQRASGRKQSFGCTKVQERTSLWSSAALQPSLGR